MDYSRQTLSASIRAVLEQHPSATAILDVDGNVLYANNALQTLTSLAPSEWRNAKWLDYLPPSERKYLLRALLEVRDLDQPKRVPLSLPGRGQTQLYITADCAAFRRENASGFMSIVSFNVSAHFPRQESGIRDSPLSGQKGIMDTARHIMEMASAPLLLVADDGRIIYANRKAADLYGLRPEHLAQRNYFELAVDPGALANHFRHKGIQTVWHNHRVENNQTKRVELRIDHLDGDLAGIAIVAVRDLEEVARNKEIANFNEERWRFALEGNGDGIWDWRIDLGIFHFSAQHARMLGYAPQESECSFEDLKSRIHPEDLNRAINTLYEALKFPDAVYYDEFRIRGSDNEWKWVAARGKVVSRDAAGEPIRMLGTHRNVNEWAQLTHKIWASENKWSQLFHLSPTAITVTGFGLDDNILEANQAFLELSGFTRSEIVGKNVRQLHLWPDDDERRELLQQVMLGKKIADRRILLRRKDGKLVPVAISLQAINLGSSKVILAIRRDLTEAEHAYEALRISEARWQFAIEGAGDALWDWDIRENSVFRSPRWADILGVENDNLSPYTIESFVSHVHEDDRVALEEQLEGIRQGNVDSFRGDYRFITPNGLLWISMTGKVMSRDEENRALRVIGTIRDISQRKRAEDETRRQKEQLTHSARLIQLGELASAMAHEINQPLTAIANFSGACLRAMHDAQSVSSYLEKIQQQALRAGEIVWRMRDFSRKRGYARSPVSLSTLITQVFDWVRPEARLYDVNLIFHEYDAPLPMVRVDRVQIEQVLLNLVTNAIDAMRTSTEDRAVEVTLRAVPEEHKLVVSVSDTGPGIPESIAHEIFKPFFTTKESGLGLGLSVSNSIIEDHGGQLWLLSPKTSGHGTTFYFSLPIIESDLDE